MKAIVVATPGGSDQLQLREVPDPVAGPGEVVIRVAASAVNRADIMQRQGHYPPPSGAPEWLGLECSGTIVALGPDAVDPDALGGGLGGGLGDWAVGDEVCALLSGGGYAEQVAVPVGQLLPIPTRVSLVDAAALPEVTCTVWSNVFMLAGLRPGETLLIHGGSSGIGTMAIQLACQIGARVAVTAGTADKLARCAELGAGIGINYREQDFVAELKAATDGRGADVILDLQGAAYLAGNVEALAVNGRLVVIGLQGGRRAELDLGLLLAKRAAVLATSLRGRPPAEKAAIVAAVREHVWPLLADGVVRPVIHDRLPLAQAARAHDIVEASTHVGKVVLTV